jgi:hypothetical protein
MSFSALNRLPHHLRPRREKEYGPARGIPLDRNAKARIRAYVAGYNSQHKTARQHRGPITWAVERVLLALLYGFHNSKDGRCFPSYEAIAKRANCARSTVYEAIQLLEAIGILTWVNRIVKVREPALDLFGQWVHRGRTLRTSNAYLFRDPLPCAQSPGIEEAQTAGNPRNSSKSENPTGTLNPSLSSSMPPPKIVVLDPASELDAALIRLGRGIGAIPEAISNPA